VVAAHGLGGTVGALLTGVFAQKALNGVADGLLFGNPRQLMIQAIAVAAAIVYSGAMSFVLLKLIGLVIPLRADAQDEANGLDMTQHGEEAYIHESDVSGRAYQAALSDGVKAHLEIADRREHRRILRQRDEGGIAHAQIFFLVLSTKRHRLS
jgi:hypothetical protein